MPYVQGDLLERDSEFAALTARLESARAGVGGLVLLEGTAGSGKTALMRWLRSAGQGMRTLQATGGELEREFAFGVVRQLLEPPLRAASEEERARLLEGAAAVAAPVLGVGGEGGEPSADASFATLHGLYWLVAALAEHEPLVLVVDDAHWADAPSLRFLEFLARRAPELPVLVAVAFRPREPGAEHELLARLADAPEVDVIRPAPLSLAAVGSLVHATLEERADEAVVTAAHETTGGNALLVAELLRSLHGVDAVSAEVVREAVPSSVTRSVERRMMSLAPTSRQVVRALAVLGARQPGERVSAFLGLEMAALTEALAELRDTGLIEGAPAEFVHPLLRQAVVDAVPAEERDDLHRRMAEMLRDVPGADEDVVAYLLAGPLHGDAWVAPVLRSAGRQALADGAWDVALRRLRRALEEQEATGAPAEDLVLELADVEASVGDTQATRRLAAAARSADPEIAAQATIRQIAIGTINGPEESALTVPRVHDLIAQLSDPALRTDLTGQLLNLVTLEPRLAEERAQILAQTTGGADPPPFALAALAFERANGQAHRDDVVALARRALAAAPPSHVVAVEQPSVLAWAIIALCAVDAPGPADAALREAEATARRSGSRLAQGFADFMRTQWLLEFGSAASAEARARDSIAVFQSFLANETRDSVRAELGLALTRLGQLDEADALYASFPGEDELGERLLGGITWSTRIQLRLAQGRVDDAVSDGRKLMRYCERYGWHRFALGSSVAHLARALALSGQIDEARELAQAEADSGRDRDIATHQAEALMALGHVERGDRALEAFGAAREAAERSGSVYVRACAALELGSALRRANRRADARKPLAAARDLAHRVDARMVLERATEELKLAGGRPRRIALSGAESLTPGELRVAEHAARGLTNRQIAELLFVTRKTVEFQLGAAYGKLGIASRTELGAALDPDSPGDRAA